MNVWIAPKLSKLPMTLAIVKPMLTKPKVISSIMGRENRKVIGLNAIPNSEPKTKTIMP